MSKKAFIRDTFRYIEGALRVAGIDDALTEARILIQHVLQVDGARFLLRLDDALDSDQKREIDEVVKRRLLREPLAYIVGHVEFYDIDVIVDRRVLVPRPETEILVDTALDWLRERHDASQIVDIGTGSGCVAVVLANHAPRTSVIAIDRSLGALEIAKQNVDRYILSERVTLCQGDLLSNLESSVDLVVANPPYIPTADIDDLMPEVRDYEPRIALDGGSDGLGFIDKILLQSRDFINPSGAIIIEIGFDQASEAVSMARQYFPSGEIKMIQDFAGVERILAIYLVDQ
jgi:release factor glutamine methyltransferase